MIPDQINPSQAQAADGDRNNLNGRASLAEDFDAFLTLLTTQLQNQDPLEPMDSSEFTNQLVAFAGVEQSISSNDKLDDLIALQGGSRAATAVAHLGKEIEAEGDQLALQDGAAGFAYTLDGSAETATIEIANAQGALVRSLQVEGGVGRHEGVWDGLDNNGNAVPDGPYSLTLSAVDENNGTVQGRTSTFGQVTGFEQTAEGIFLNMGDISVALDKVQSVREPGSNI